MLLSLRTSVTSPVGTLILSPVSATFNEGSRLVNFYKKGGVARCVGHAVYLVCASKTCTVCVRAQIFDGSFGGATLYDNPSYTSPNAIRAALKRKASSKYGSKVAQRDRRTEHKAKNPLPRNPMEGLFKGEDGGGDSGGGDE